MDYSSSEKNNDTINTSSINDGYLIKMEVQILLYNIRLFNKKKAH